VTQIFPPAFVFNNILIHFGDFQILFDRLFETHFHENKFFARRFFIHNQIFCGLHIQLELRWYSSAKWVKQLKCKLTNVSNVDKLEGAHWTSCKIVVEYNANYSSDAFSLLVNVTKYHEFNHDNDLDNWNSIRPPSEPCLFSTSFYCACEWLTWEGICICGWVAACPWLNWWAAWRQ